MIATHDNVTSIHEVNLRIAEALGRTAFKVAESAGALWRAALRDGAADMKALWGAKDVGEILEIEGSLAQRGLQTSIGFCRQTYDILVATRKDVWKLLGAEMTELNKSAAALLEQAGAPEMAPSDTAMLSALRAADEVAGTVDEAIIQAAAMTEASIAAFPHVRLVHVGLPRPKARKRHELGQTAQIEPVARSGAARKRALRGV